MRLKVRTRSLVYIALSILMMGGLAILAKLCPAEATCDYCPYLRGVFLIFWMAVFLHVTGVIGERP